MYASEQIGASGLVVGVDRHSVKVSLPDNASYLELDALALEPEHLTELGISRFDVVLSDMAPHTSGDRFVDQQRSLRLFLRALALARSYTRRGGSFVGKIFQGEDLDEARAEAEASFERVRLYRPAATRKRSYEIYLICQGRLAPAPA
jgi:23S rRNA (uridine2552-2'-O)-methyltransferase